jgi:hypothetical protein
MPNTTRDRERVAGATEHELKTAQAAMKREGIKIPAKEIKAFVKKYGHNRVMLYSLLRIHNAAKGLQYMSESDYPFEVIVMDAEDPAITSESVDLVDIEDFFKNKPELAGLQEVLTKELQDVQVYRNGLTEVDAYVVGRLANGDLGGVKTKLIET